MHRAYRQTDRQTDRITFTAGDRAAPPFLSPAIIAVCHLYLQTVGGFRVWIPGKCEIFSPDFLKFLEESIPNDAMVIFGNTVNKKPHTAGGKGERGDKWWTHS